jgi:large subunit ribosomal protein L23
MEILKKPILTEKASALTEKLNRYRANKLQIKAAVEKMFGVQVKSVNTAVVTGKMKSRQTKTGIASGRVAKYKKAIITLNDGDIIDFYSTIQ